MPSRSELRTARRLYRENEPRDFQYKVAYELLDMARKRTTNISQAEALAVLLLGWNATFYRMRPELRRSLLDDLEGLLRNRRRALDRFASRSIKDFSDQDEKGIRSIFEAFEKRLWPVGAAKALHLLAPRFFPLWDTAIARGYGLGAARPGHNADRYWSFMVMVKREWDQLGGERVLGPDGLKALDEYNYVKFTLRRM